MSTANRTIIDDSSSSVTYLGDGWEVQNAVQWYGGSSHFHTPSPEQSPASINIVFEGTSLELYGVGGEAFTVIIDQGPPTLVPDGGGVASYRRWYQSPELPNGTHTITILDIDTVSFDYALVTAGQGTALGGKRVLVDNEDEAISWSGEWSWTPDSVDTQNYRHASALGGSTQRTFTAGDAFSFNFSGTSVALYGTFSWWMLGSMSVTYTVDGQSVVDTYSVTTSSPEFVSGLGDAPNFHFFSNDALQPGLHTLEVKIDSCANQTFALDYITYSPLSAEVVPALTTTSTSDSSTRPTSTIPPSPSKSSSLPLSSSVSRASREGSRLDGRTIVAIIGGSVGGLVFLVGALFLAFCLIKRRHGPKYKYGPRSHKAETSDSFTPLIGPKESPTSFETPSHYSAASPLSSNDLQRPFLTLDTTVNSHGRRVLTSPQRNRRPTKPQTTIETQSLLNNRHDTSNRGHQPSADSAELSYVSADVENNFRPPWLTPVTEQPSPTSMYSPPLNNLSTRRHSPLAALSNLSTEYIPPSRQNRDARIIGPHPRDTTNLPHTRFASEPQLLRLAEAPLRPVRRIASDDPGLSALGSSRPSCRAVVQHAPVFTPSLPVIPSHPSTPATNAVSIPDTLSRDPFANPTPTTTSPTASTLSTSTTGSRPTRGPLPQPPTPVTAPQQPPLSPLRRVSFSTTRPVTIDITTPATPATASTPAYVGVLSGFWPRTGTLAALPSAGSQESFGNVEVPPAYHTLSRHPSTAAAGTAVEGSEEGSTDE